MLESIKSKFIKTLSVEDTDNTNLWTLIVLYFFVKIKKRGRVELKDNNVIINKAVSMN